MSTLQVKISRNSSPTPAQPAVFSPQALTANAGDNVTWFNGDKQAHWPAPTAANPTEWFAFQIPAGSESRGDLALGPNPVAVTSATNGAVTVFTTQSPAPQAEAVLQ